MSEGRKFDIVAEIKVGLTQEDVDDIMCSALDYIGYWCRRTAVVGEYLGEYASEQIGRGGTLILHDTESDDKWELTLEKFLNGFKLWIENGCDNYGAVEHGQVDTRQIDGQSADMIVQFALFEEVMFA